MFFEDCLSLILSLGSVSVMVKKNYLEVWRKEYRMFSHILSKQETPFKNTRCRKQSYIQVERQFNEEFRWNSKRNICGGYEGKPRNE